MALRYEGYYNYDGFQLVYFQADPGKPPMFYLYSQQTHFKNMPEFCHIVLVSQSIPLVYLSLYIWFCICDTGKRKSRTEVPWVPIRIVRTSELQVAIGGPSGSGMTYIVLSFLQPLLL